MRGFDSRGGHDTHVSQHSNKSRGFSLSFDFRPQGMLAGGSLGLAPKWDLAPLDDQSHKMMLEAPLASL